MGTAIRVEYGLSTHGPPWKYAVGYSSENPPEADFCNVSTYDLHLESNQTGALGLPTDYWSAPTEYQAEYVRRYSTPWYNSSKETPRHYEPMDYTHVVRIETGAHVRSIKQVQNIALPTVLEMFEHRYAEKNPEHFEYLKQINARHVAHILQGEQYEPLTYSWYDLVEWLRDVKGYTYEQLGV